MTHIQSICNSSYGDHARQQCDIFIPDTQNNQTPLLLLIHGGWLSAGHKDELRGLALHCATLGYPSATIGYRFPTDIDPDITNDIVAASAHAQEEARCLGWDGEHIILLGSGSGSLLALSASIRCPKTLGVIACGVTPTTNAPKSVSTTSRNALQKLPENCNPSQLSTESFPPALLLHGDADNDVSAKDARLLHSALCDNDNISTLSILAGAPHQFIENTHSSASRSALTSIQDWIKQLDTPTDQNALTFGEPVFVK